MWFYHTKQRRVNQQPINLTHINITDHKFRLVVHIFGHSVKRSCSFVNLTFTLTMLLYGPVQTGVELILGQQLLSLGALFTQFREINIYGAMTRHWSAYCCYWQPRDNGIAYITTNIKSNHVCYALTHENKKCILKVTPSLSKVNFTAKIWKI